MKIGILTIGDEVIEGKIVNSNASYLAKVLETNQLNVSIHLAVRDQEESILQALDYLYQSVDTVVTTGGLGPTVDDLTKEVCARYFNEQLYLDEEQLSIIELYFQKAHRDMPVMNHKQAYFIKGAMVINNDNGTAPGMIYEKNQKIIINLPGPPKELEPMLYETVLPYLKSKENIKVLKKQFRLMNTGESHTQTVLEPLYQKYPEIKIAPYASVGVVDYMISVIENNNNERFEACCALFEQYLGEYIVGDWNQTIQEILVSLLKEKGLTLAIAESCTGGMISSSIVDVSGSSQVFIEGIVTYHNDSKVKRLGVKEETLKTFGAVSRECAMEMAKGVREKTQVDIGISVTGIAGPTGGTKEKPVGLVYTAISFHDKIMVHENYFVGNRLKIRQRAMMFILFELYQILIKTL